MSWLDTVATVNNYCYGASMSIGAGGGGGGLGKL